MDIQTLFDGIPDNWQALINECLPQLETATKQIMLPTSPAPNKWFEFARVTPLDKVCVIIIGMDPYPNVEDAHGLAFSSMANKTPASLKNIFKCLIKRQLLPDMPSTNDLTPWAKQGVLLLNSALCTTPGKAGAYLNQWLPFTQHLLENVILYRINQIAKTDKNVKNEKSDKNKKDIPLYVLLWGNDAKKLAPICAKHLTEEHILTYTHPSPLAQSKALFEDCLHFKILDEKLSPKINWVIDWGVSKQVIDGFKMTSDTVVIFTDGSCYPNKICPESRGGYAAHFALGKFTKNIYGSLFIDIPPTNIRCEGMAIIVALQFLREQLNEWNKVIIVSDSEFWINMITKYIPDWLKKNINLESKANPDLTKKLVALTKFLTDNNKIVEYRHIYSHGKSNWHKCAENTYEYFSFCSNDYADKLCEAGRMLKPGTQCLSDTVYD